MFRNRISYWCEEKGAIHKHLAKKLEVSPQTFSSWVNNKTQPDLKQSWQLSRILHISMEDLIEWEENENE